MAAASEMNGYLLEDHFATMRTLQLFQRPGSPRITVGKTLILVDHEGQAGERRQRVRIKDTNTEIRTFTVVDQTGKLVEFDGMLTSCELQDPLLYDFPGSPPSPLFARQTGKTKIRETVYNDAGLFYGASRLRAPCSMGDTWLQLDSIYTQVVPNSRTETANIDQLPAAQRALVLAETPRRIEVGIAPHTQRLRVSEENAGLVYVFQARPYPAPGTVILSFRAMGTWYTLADNGSGQLSGSGSGTVNYLTGSMSVTLQAVPDIGSSIVLAWGENTAFTNRAGGAAWRQPEHAWQLPHQHIKPASVTITWQSGGVTKTVTDNGAGQLSGTGGAGRISYASGTISLTPAALIDAGGEYLSSYVYRPEVTDYFPGTTPDAGGFALLPLSDTPAPHSVQVEWATVRNVSSSSGSTEVVSRSASMAGVDVQGQQIVKTARGYHEFIFPPPPYAPGSTITVQLQAPAADDGATFAFTASGTHEVTVTPASGNITISAHGSGPNLAHWGSVELTIGGSSTDPERSIQIEAKDATGVRKVWGSRRIEAGSAAPKLPPADCERLPSGEVRALPGKGLGGYSDSGERVHVILPPVYQDNLGWVYNPPARGDQRWTGSELIYGKTLVSSTGAELAYQRWTA